MAIPAISKLTTTPPRKRGRKSDERRSNSGFMPRGSWPGGSYWRLAALEKRPEPAADPHDDHHHRSVEDQQQRIDRHPPARERGDIGESAQELRRADEAGDRGALGGVDQKRDDLRRRSAQGPRKEVHPA